VATPQYVNAAQPIDRNGQPLPILRASGTRVNLTSGAASTNSALPAGGSQVVYIRSTTDIFYNFGTSGAVTASNANTSVLFPAGESVVVVPTGSTHIAVIQVTAAGVVQVEGVDG
jgi:hypothetical protein